MRKSDVQLNYHQANPQPMLNIKVHAPYPWPTRKDAEDGRMVVRRRFA